MASQDQLSNLKLSQEMSEKVQYIIYSSGFYRMCDWRVS